MKRRLRDFWRGYSDADAISLRAKLCAPGMPGGVTWISNREMRALRHGECDVLLLTEKTA